MLIEGSQFERLTYIWEFFTNFADFFKIATFKLEELQAALTLGHHGQPLFDPPKDLKDDEEPPWEDYITNKTVLEQGFGLVNTLMLAIVDCFFSEAKNNSEEKGSDIKETQAGYYSDDKLLSAVIRYFDGSKQAQEYHWPEFVRIILKSKRFSM